MVLAIPDRIKGSIVFVFLFLRGMTISSSQITMRGTHIQLSKTQSRRPSGLVVALAHQRPSKDSLNPSHAAL